MHISRLLCLFSPLFRNEITGEKRGFQTKPAYSENYWNMKWPENRAQNILDRALEPHFRCHGKSLSGRAERFPNACVFRVSHILLIPFSLLLFSNSPPLPPPPQKNWLLHNLSIHIPESALSLRALYFNRHSACKKIKSGISVVFQKKLSNSVLFRSLVK